MTTTAPRWIGDQKPDLPPELEYAARLPPKITEKYVLFFGYEGPWPEVCLQQWYPSPFKTHTGELFHTTEQYMMWKKALVMSDEETAGKILACKTPAEAKQLGREVKNFDQAIWDNECDQIVEDANWYKFSQDPKLAEVLLGTGDRQIVEASPNDRIWGVGFNAADALGREVEWGTNKLGKALERVRKRLHTGKDF